MGFHGPDARSQSTNGKVREMKLRVEKLPTRPNKPPLWAVQEIEMAGPDPNWKELKVFTRKRDAKDFVRGLGRLMDLR